MPNCDACGNTILFGGMKQDGMTYCNNACAQKGAMIHGGVKVPVDFVEQQAALIHQGNCPKCGGSGPVDVHKSHTVYSFLVMTRWASSPALCCRSCGRKKQLGAAATSLLLGWWGFPWGFIMTPVQIVRNITGVLGLSGPKPSTPSPDLHKIVQLTMINRQNAAAAQPAQGPRFDLK
jgi:hypothetical protein